MERYILMVNYIESSIPDLENSKFYNEMGFAAISSARELTLPTKQKSPDIIIIFLEQEKQGYLNRIAHITKTDLDKEVIAAVPDDMRETGVRALENGASDFLILPSDAHTLDFYINRCLERTYMHQHICFNDSCYKSRYARSEKNYKQLFNEVPCFIYTVDRDYQLTDHNNKFVNYFGSHVGEYCFGILKNRDEPCPKCMISKTFLDGKNRSSEMQIISSDGVKHIMLAWVAPIRATNGEVTDALCMLTDVTEARRLEDHLTSLGFMIGSISHGLKGLLTGLDGGMYLIEKGLEQNQIPRIKEGFAQSQELNTRIKRLVLDILYYAKTRRMEYEEVSVNNFVDTLLMTISRSAAQRRIEINRKFENLNTNETFEVDENALLAAMINILENSVEACSENPPERPGAIFFQVKIDHDKVLFTVQDNGPGMDKATLKNIFTIFFSSKGNKGTGLGLYIANKVVTRHQGKIKATSKKGKGTRFLIRIPRKVPVTARDNV